MIREALKALEEGSPRLLFLGPPEELAARGREGVVTVPIACQSEGALEVYVEPVLPQPHLRRDRAIARRRYARLDWPACSGGGRSSSTTAGSPGLPRGRRRRHDARPRAGGRERPLDRRRGDAGPLRRRRRSGSARDAGPYVGLVASRKRAGRCSGACTGPRGVRRAARARARPRDSTSGRWRTRRSQSRSSRARPGAGRGRSPRRRPPRSAARGARRLRHDRGRRRREVQLGVRGDVLLHPAAGCLHRFERDTRFAAAPRLNPMSRVRFHP